MENMNEEMEKRLESIPNKILSAAMNRNYDDYNKVVRAIQQLHESGWDPEGAITVLFNIVTDADNLEWNDERINGPVIDGVKLGLDEAKLIHWVMLEDTVTPLATTRISKWRDANKFESCMEEVIRRVVTIIKNKREIALAKEEEKRKEQMMKKVEDAFASLGL